ncbi:centromere protein U isoform 2-T2 [Porphyrio hochstetteri]
MSSKKKTKKNHLGDKLKEHKASSHPRRLISLEEPDVSRILKVAEGNELEELDDSFEHPLHSTAVDAYGEEHSQNESPGHASAPQRRNTERKVHRPKTSDLDAQKLNTTDSEDELLKEDERDLHTTQLKAERKQLSEKNTSDPSVAIPCSLPIWCPKELKRSPRDITELDVVLAEFEEAAADYRQNIESSTGRRAIDGFCSAFRDQITDLIADVQELKNMKKKNAKVITDIRKKRQRLLQLRDKLIGAETQMLQLQREYTELQERKSSLRQATELLTDLKELQQDCLDYREENPKEKVVYGTSSLPALLVESRGILRAEKHFHSINVKLEGALAVQREKLSKKH